MTSPASAYHAVESLDNDDRLRVLGIVDQFRELGINEDISLPQLVVVGDQSSGKSSLLEGVTGLNFPIASELCTRFATQIVLRRAPEGQGSIKVSILAGPTSGQVPDEKARLDAFSRTIDGEDLSKDAFAKILDEAAICMGLPASSEGQVDDLLKRFSDDVLKIELAGPEHHHLSVVDVPGLFHNPTKYQTQEDLDTIRGLIESYITDKRTIILAVMDARNNLANQEVFRMARSADPVGKRTVGIITKCDALQAGDEDMVLRIAKNEVERLTHGWFAVRNRSTQEIQDGVTLAHRHTKETSFFQTSPWKQLPKDRVGVNALKQFLAGLLYDHVRGEFPLLVDEIRELVRDTGHKLDKLGNPRQSAQQQRQYLTRLATQYRQHVSDCLKGDYDSSWTDADPRKLRMLLHLENDKFATSMRQKGHKYVFKKVDKQNDYVFGEPAAVDSEEDQADDCALHTDTGDIYQWIRARYRQSRGAELPGTINPAVLENLFRQQASRWKDFAESHVDTVKDIVNKYISTSFQDLIIDDDIRQNLVNRAMAQQSKADNEATKQLNAILADELTGILQTTNHYFADNVTKIRKDRVVQRLKEAGLTNFSSKQHTSLAAVTAAVHLSNEDQAVYDIHDTLKAYYKVAMKRFVDNVVLQIVERCYLGEQGPVKFLSAQYIGELSDEALADIAQESYASSSVRTELMYRMERLERALGIAEKERI